MHDYECFTILDKDDIMTGGDYLTCKISIPHPSEIMSVYDKRIAYSQGHAMDYDNFMKPVTIFVGHEDDVGGSIATAFPLKKSVEAA